LRKRILDACGLEDEKFEEVYLLLENLLGKTKLNQVLNSLSSADRNALEALSTKPDSRKIEAIVGKY
jgi:hypothetical protein